jgi:hypothetical protein
LDNPTLLIYNVSIRHDFQIVELVRFVVPSPKEKKIGFIDELNQRKRKKTLYNKKKKT